jgi:hypothetical protein
MVFGALRPYYETLVARLTSVRGVALFSSVSRKMCVLFLSFAVVAYGDPICGTRETSTADDGVHVWLSTSIGPVLAFCLHVSKDAASISASLTSAKRVCDPGLALSPQCVVFSPDLHVPVPMNG